MNISWVVGFEVFTAVVMKSIIFWDSACHLLARWFTEPISSTLKMEAMFLRNVD
jgi:hypothetical protein